MDTTATEQRNRSYTPAPAPAPVMAAKRVKVMVVLTDTQVKYLDGISFRIRQATGEKIDRSTILRQVLKYFIRADLTFEKGDDLKRFEVRRDDAKRRATLKPPPVATGCGTTGI